MKLVDLPTVASQASAYELVLVDRQTRPINPNVYAEMTPMTAMIAVAGIMAEGEFPNVATPAQDRRTNESSRTKKRDVVCVCERVRVRAMLSRSCGVVFAHYISFGTSS